MVGTGIVPLVCILPWKAWDKPGYEILKIFLELKKMANNKSAIDT